MPLSLKTPEKVRSLPGQTFVSDDGPWAKPTGIYIPPNAHLGRGVVNVLLWLHGWYVTSIEQLLDSDRAQVREQVLNSDKNVILVAPWLGHGHGSGTFHVGMLKGGWGESYLHQVLGVLALDLGAGPGLRLGKLAIGCHSAGGAAMRNLVGSLGPYRWNLRECCGFDCLYGGDDATFWYNWVTGGDGRPLYVSYGPSTVPQSVKLYLMGEGLATDKGARRNPEGPDISDRLHVTLGLPNAPFIDDLLGLDKLLMATTPTPRHPHPSSSNFVEQAAGNLTKKTGWPPSNQLMALHYRIASDGLLERLKAASFL